MGAHATAAVRAAVHLLLLAWCLVASARAAAKSSPPIQVQLRAPWASPPLVLEILEAACEEEPSSFFTLLSHITSPWAFDGIVKGERLNAREAGYQLQQATDDKVHAAAKRILDERDLLQQRGQRDNYELSLALRSQTPKIEAFWQLYQTSGLQQRWEEGRARTRNAGGGGECGSWVDFAGQVICSDEELIHALEGYDSSKEYNVTPDMTPFDHVFTSSVSEGKSSSSAPTAVLYADPFSPEFWNLHKRLTEYALGARSGANALRYILRWKPLQREEKDVYLAGYGAYLDLKKVDYLVIDDRKLTDTAAVQGSDDGAAKKTDSDATKQLLADQEWLSKQLKTTKEDEEQTIGSLEEPELAEMATRGAYVVAKSKQPLRALRQLSQDFPKHGVALARSAPNPSKSFLSELAHHHQVSMQSGANDVWLNGKLISAKDFQPLGLLPILRSERAIVNALTNLNLSTDEALSLLTSPIIGKAYTPDESNAPFFDASDRIERNMSSKDLEPSEVAAIAYWNDIEKEDDPRYSRWSRDLKSVLRPLYPGSFPIIQRNLFNLILVMDLEKLDACKFISDTVSMATARIAIRWGIVPSNIGDPTSASTQLARLFWLVYDQVGPEKSGKYLRRVVSASSSSVEGVIEVATAEKEAVKMLKMDIDAIHAALGEYSERERLAQHYVQRLRADEYPQGHAFVNGQHMPFGPQLFQYLQQAISAQIQLIGPEIYYGQVEEDADVSTYFYDLPGTYSSRSELIFPPEETVIKMASVEIGEDDVKDNHFIYPATTSSTPPNSTVWIAGDLDSEQGVRLLRDVVKVIDEANVRLGFLHQPVASSSAQPTASLSTFLYQLLSSPTQVSSAQLIEVLETYTGKEDNLYEATSTPDQVILDDAASAINKMKAQSWTAPEADLSAQYWQESGSEMKKSLNVASGTYALVINGKVVSGFSPANLTSTDYQGLFQKEAAKTDAVVSVLSNVTTVSADLATRAASILEKAYFVDASLDGIFDAPVKTRNMIMDQLIFKETIFTLGDKQKASLRFSVLLDPVTETAQKWSSVLEMLAEMEDVYIQVILNPTTILRELPIKRYYRYSAPSRLAFTVNGGVVREKLEFQDMPLDAVLTRGLDAPPSWLTMASDAIYDLDNIRLKDVATSAVSAIYDLKYLLIEGHVRDEVVKATPRGLQIVLETVDGSEQLDTIVMANLAYFQFRTRPGLYRLRLRPGRSTDLFDMVSVGNAGMDSPRVEVTGDGISLTTLQGLTVYPRIAKKKGREREILVEDESEGQVGAVPGGAAGAKVSHSGANLIGKAKGLLSSLTHSVKSSVEAPSSVGKKKSNQADINVFTVASGHLYERMTYIMILSTLKHTTQTVKFWFIENFLSPSFKDFIPHLANEYKFDYELVTYAWPHWLRSQKEKQREIWGMKVLFLDVIFPLDLSKVIFVDADQIVRADLQELIDTDLHGAPYGFPPMGNDSYDMDNFRFWEQPGGYWERFLNGKPYPISALYVVDLNKFRLQAAGDKLRGNYQALTQDPNSLSNLDQDLVASMIHVVNIHSLEKEWLWCETWCSWDWYDKAKSIDLCSNPKTKEPKLDRAKRQIPEWTVLDDEVAQVAKRLKEEGKLGANVVAPGNSGGKGRREGFKEEKESEHKHAAQHDEL